MRRACQGRRCAKAAAPPGAGRRRRQPVGHTTARSESPHQDAHLLMPVSDGRQGDPPKWAERTLNQIRRMLKMAPNSVACCSILRWKSGLVRACALPHSQCSEGGCGSSASALRLCNQLHRARQCHTKKAPAATHAASTVACSIGASSQPARSLRNVEGRTLVWTRLKNLFGVRNFPARKPGSNK